MFAGASPSQAEGKALDALHAGASENRRVRGDLDRQTSMCAAAMPCILSLGVFAHDDPVDRRSPHERTLHSRQQAGGAYVRVLIEALRDRQAQFPQRDVVWHMRAAD